MKRSLNRISPIATLAAIVFPVWTFAAEPQSDAELWEGAQNRIEKHRKADATILVVDAAGEPVPGAEISIDQKRHEFLFGCNIFLFGRAGDQESETAYRTRFRELFNYATLGFYWGNYERRQGEPQKVR